MFKRGAQPLAQRLPADPIPAELPLRGVLSAAGAVGLIDLSSERDQAGEESLFALTVRPVPGTVDDQSVRACAEQAGGSLIEVGVKDRDGRAGLELTAARRVPRRSAEWASARQARALARVRKVFRIVFASRWEKTCA